MTASARKIITWSLAVASTVVITAALLLYIQNNSAPEIPTANLSAMESAVGARIRMYSSALKLKPDSADAWAKLAQVFHAHDLFAQAIEAYAHAMELEPGDSRWPYLAAVAQAEMNPQESLPLFQRAIDLQPVNAAVYINFGDTLTRLGKYDEAGKAYQKALTIGAESSYALYGLARVAMVENDPDQALLLLGRAVAVSPYHGELYKLLAQVYQRLGDEEAARHHLMLANAWPDSTRGPDPVVQAMESLATDSQSITRRGISLAKRGEYRDAEAAFRKVLEIRPGNARDFANLGGALAGQGRSQEALAVYRRGLEVDADDVDTLNNLGFSLFKLRQYEEAEKHLLRALELDPGFAAVLGNLGLLAEQRQEMDRAVGYFKQALEQSPGLVFARNALANRLAIQGDTAAAAGHWRTVLEINPRELSAIYNLAMLLAADGDHAGAIAYLRQGLSYAPNSSRLVAALAWQLATAPEDELRSGAEAMQLAQRVYGAYPDQSQMIDVMAAALAETGDFDNAVKLMEKIVKPGSGETQALSMRLKSYRQRTAWRQASSTDR